MVDELSLDLGFLESAPSWSLSSRFFPSKVGGRPSWLALRDLPEPSCPLCGRGLGFLAQVYAPLEHEPRCDPMTFHRTLFVLFCRNPGCHEQSAADEEKEGGSRIPFRVFRSQLSRENEYYPEAPPVEQADWRTDLRAEKYGTICR